MFEHDHWNFRSDGREIKNANELCLEDPRLQGFLESMIGS
jgi:hypothetical protein